MKNIYLITGPSGCGKTTISHNVAAHALYMEREMKCVESYTTRPPRYPGEKGHIFVTDEEFDKLGEMVAYTEYNGYRYGVTEDIIDKCDLYVIDPAGVKTLKDRYKGKKGIIVIRIQASEEACAEHMLHRGDSLSGTISRVINDRNVFTPENEDYKIHFTVDNTPFLGAAWIPVYEFICHIEYGEPMPEEVYE